MITNKSNKQLHEEIIIDTDTLCTQLESGNPFLSNQDLIYSRKKSKAIIDTDDSCSLSPDGKKLSESASTFFDIGFKRSMARLNKNPNSTSLLNSIAQNHLKKREFDKAIKILNKVLSIDNSFFPAIANLAECYANKNEINKALELYDQIDEDRKNDANVLINRALLHLRNKNFDIALEILSKASKLYPKNATVFNNKGLIYLVNNQPNKAIQYLRKAIRLKSDDFAIFNNLGVSFAAINNNKKALTNFKIAFSLNPLERNVVKNLVNVYQIYKNYESMISLLDEYLANNQEDNEMRNFICLSYFEVGSNEKCLKELQRIVSLTKDTDKIGLASAYNNIALVLSRMGRTSEAKKFFIESHKANPNPSIGIYCNIIGFFLTLRDLEHTKYFLDIALKQHENSPILLNYLGMYSSFYEDYATAKKLYLEALKLDEQLLDGYINLSVIECDVYENYDKAIEIAKKGLRFHPKSSILSNNYAYCHLMKGNLEEARRILDNVIGNDYVHLIATRGLLLLKEGNLTEGRKYYNRAASLAGKNKNLYSLVNQKKHLELAKYYLDRDEKKLAIQNLKTGLKFNTVEKYYQMDIQKIYNSLTKKSKPIAE